MSDKNSPLGGRGKAEEERWAREQDRQAIEKMKEKDGKGTDTKAGEKTCKCKEAKKAGKKNEDKTGCCGGK